MAEAIDGFVSLIDGMQGGIDSTLIPETAYAQGVNLSCRRGLIQTRPGFLKVADLSRGTLFQGAGRWSLSDSDRIAFCIDGVVSTIDLNTMTVTDLGLQMDATVPQVYCYQTERWFTIQDGVSRPLVLKEASGVVSVFGRDAPDVCLSIGTVGIYTHGRIHYTPTYVPTLSPDQSTFPTAVPVPSTESGRMGFVSSDVLDLLNPEYLFRMREHRILNEGGELELPQELGFVTGMANLRNADTGTGVGALLVFGRNGVSAFDISLGRDQWKQSGVAISQVLFFGSSCAGPYAMAPVNGDIYFVDTEGGLRSIKYSGSESKNALTDTPMSNEVEEFVNDTNREHSTLVNCDNRVTYTVQGEEKHYLGLVSLDNAALTARGSSAQSLFDGVWTGFKFVHQVAAVYQGRLRLFVIVEKDSGGFALLMLDNDTYYDPGDTPIECQLMTRTMNFKALTNVKTLKFVEVWLSGVRHTSTMTVYCRPTGYPYWQDLGMKTIRVPAGTPEQVRRAVRFAIDFNQVTCDNVTKESLMTGDGLQFLIMWTGHLRIERMRATADVALEAPPMCGEDNMDLAAYTVGVANDPFSYEVPL